VVGTRLRRYRYISETNIPQHLTTWWQLCQGPSLSRATESVPMGARGVQGKIRFLQIPRHHLPGGLGPETTKLPLHPFFLFFPSFPFRPDRHGGGHVKCRQAGTSWNVLHRFDTGNGCCHPIKPCCPLYTPGATHNVTVSSALVASKRVWSLANRRRDAWVR
jgi:hypothetical protein